MNKTDKIIGIFFGALLMLAFFLPWVQTGAGAIQISITGYDLVSAATKVKNFMGRDFDALTYFIFLFPITGAISILFSGIVRLPFITLFSAMATITYITVRIAYFGWDNLQRTLNTVGLGLWISLACVVVIFANSAIQTAGGKKKKK